MTIQFLRRFSSVAAMLALPLAVIGLIARNIERAASGPPREYVEQPDHWVAFSADVRVEKPNSVPVLGRFARAVDGSRYLATGLSRDDARVIQIVNVPEATLYLFTRGEWSRESVVIPNNGRPLRWVNNANTWSVYTHKLAIKRGESGSLEAGEGFSAYQVRDRGAFWLKVPELNLFDVVYRRGDGRSETYSNIELGEPPRELFHPPVGVRIIDPSERRRPPIPSQMEPAHHSRP